MAVPAFQPITQWRLAGKQEPQARQAPGQAPGQVSFPYITKD